jgi:hypothetical protein
MKLTDTQLMLLSAASQRKDHAIELPENLKGAANKVIGKLLTEGLIEEIRARRSAGLASRERGRARTLHHHSRPLGHPGR